MGKENVRVRKRRKEAKKEGRPTYPIRRGNEKKSNRAVPQDKGPEGCPGGELGMWGDTKNRNQRREKGTGDEKPAGGRGSEILSQKKKGGTTACEIQAGESQ